MAVRAVSSAVRYSPARGDTSSANARLRSEVVNASRTLEELVHHRELLGAEVTDMIGSTIADVHRRLNRKEFAVVVVGEKKSGKSTFLNAILGARVLGTAVRECTGTVTFIRRAQQAFYRAKLQNSDIIEFQDLEAGKRSKIVQGIENLRQRLGQDIHGLALRRSAGDTDKALTQTVAEHAEATRQRAAAEAVVSKFERLYARATHKNQCLAQDRDAQQTRESDLNQKFKLQCVHLQEAERTLSSIKNEIMEHVQHQAVAIPNLQDAENRMAMAAAKLPFFMRPAPWWAFWVFPLRLFIGCFFRKRMKAFAEAHAAHRFAQLTVVASETEQRIEQIKYDMTDTTSQLHTVRQSIASTLTTMREITGMLSHIRADGQQLSFEQHLKRVRYSLAECRKVENITRLKVLYAELNVLEEVFFSRFRSEVHELTDMEKRGRDVVELTIGFPAVHLPDGITVIDTPGVNTDNAPNRERAWDVIRSEADGCLLISDMQQVISQSTRKFLHEVKAIIPHILLVMSKVDRALENAEDVGDLEPCQQVEAARCKGVLRFSKEVGRTPDEVFSIAVAAEPALRGDTSPDGLGRQFSLEVAKVFNPSSPM